MCSLTWTGPAQSAVDRIEGLPAQKPRNSIVPGSASQVAERGKAPV